MQWIIIIRERTCFVFHNENNCRLIQQAPPRMRNPSNVERIISTFDRPSFLMLFFSPPYKKCQTQHARWEQCASLISLSRKRREISHSYRSHEILFISSAFSFLSFKNICYAKQLTGWLNKNKFCLYLRILFSHNCIINLLFTVHLLGSTVDTNIIVKILLF